MASNRAGDEGPPHAGGGGALVPDLRTMEELCQPSLNGRGGPIAPIHLDKFLHVTQSMKVNGVSDDTLRLYLFPYSLQHRAAEWFDRLPRNSITTFDQMAKIFLGKYFPPSMIHANHVQNPTLAYQALALAYQAPPYQASVHQAPIPQPSTNDLKNMLGQFMKMNTASTLGSRTLLSNTITNPREDLKGITTQSCVAYKGPTIPTTSSSPKVVEHETEVTKDMVPPTNNGSTKDVQPPVVQVETEVPNSEPIVAPVAEPVEAPVSASKPNPKPSSPYPSRLNDQKCNISQFQVNKARVPAILLCLVAATEDRLSLIDTVDIVFLEQMMFVVELDEHE
ncbi:hypothetical protein Tco_1206077 [Tanacetum coccineum]